MGDYLRNIDFFSSNLTWKFLNKNKHSTNLSITLSIILIFILVFKISRMFHNLYIKRSNYNMKTTYKTDPKIKINISDMKIAFCNMNDVLSDPIKWDLGYEIEFVHFKGENESNATIITSKCSEYKNLNFINMNDSFDECLCFTPINVKLQNYYDREYETIQFILKNKTIINETINFGIFITDYFFDYSEYPNPFRETYSFMYFLINAYNYIEKDIFINKISYDDSSFDYEFGKYEGKIEEIFSIGDRSNTNIYTGINTKDLLVLSISSSKKHIFNEIVLFSLDYILATSGGIFQLFYILFEFICSMYNKIYLIELKTNLLIKENEKLLFKKKND